MRTFVLLSLVLAGCGPDEKPVPSPSSKAAAAKPGVKDESRRFPRDHLLATRVAEMVFGKDFLPGGTVAEYRRGNREWAMFVVKSASANDAAIALLDWKKALSNAELVPSFGGYFGTEGGTPMFVFTKGPWVAGVAGLRKSDADAQARLLAARLD